MLARGGACVVRGRRCLLKARRTGRGRPPPEREGRAARFSIGDERLVVVCLPLSEGALDALTPAERDVARALAEGAANREIARRRGTSERTVANQVASIYRKLGVCSRAELVVLLHTVGADARA